MAGATGGSDDAFDTGAPVVEGVPLGPKREPPGAPMAGATVVGVPAVTAGGGAVTTDAVGGDVDAVVAGVVPDGTGAVVDEPAAAVTG